MAASRNGAVSARQLQATALSKRLEVGCEIPMSGLGVGLLGELEHAAISRPKRSVVAECVGMNSGCATDPRSAALNSAYRPRWGPAPPPERYHGLIGTSCWVSAATAC